MTTAPIARLASLLLLLLLLPLGAIAQAPTHAGEPPRYGRDVRPILSENCFACHGPDEATREAGLRLDVAGDVGLLGDELLRRVATTDPGDAMPPPHTGKSLTAAEVATLRAWLAAGAPYERHWAFERPTRPAVPALAGEPSRNAIDHFVRHRLAAHGLSPSPPADRTTLVRRVYLDLIGLPPTPAQADAFVDDDAPDAYLRLVDGLLSSPHYGERHARRWLDLARYADTNGYEKDRPRSIWPYRDWVIRAFEANMPFDRFVVRQLAGDMLPDASADDRIATGFHRNTMLNEEGGIDPLEFRFHALADRVATTGSVFLGLTYGCAQCHTHKYDPITHRDYYGLMAYFDDADEPDLVVPDEAADQRARRNLERAHERLQRLWDRWPEDAAPRDQRFAAWLAERRERAVAWTPVTIERAHSNLPHLQLEAGQPGTVRASGDTTKHDTYQLELAPTPHAITALRLEALPDDGLPNGGPGLTYYEGSKGDFFLAELRVRIGGEAISFARASASYHNNQYGRHAADAAAAIDGDLQTGWSTHGRNGERHVAVFVPRQALPAGKAIAIEMHFGRHFASSLGRFRLSTTDAPGGADALALAFDDDGSDERLLGRPALADGERRTLRAAFLFDAPEVREQSDRIRKLRRRREHATTLVMQERPSDRGRVTRRHHRGEFLQPKEAIEPRLPAALGATRTPRNRLELARWLVSADNPLAARVLVNREWAALFGRGLVATPGDFGAQGAPPSHPQLLDWLAVEFVESGWNLRKLHRLIVTSHTYRQRSALRPQDLQRDPDNRWLARAPRLRLDAEVLRDAALVAAGALHADRFGPPVRPPQPAGVTEITFGSPKWRADDGDARFRRSIYTLQKRTAPFAFYATFDAPSGESCRVQRQVSDTPLQALSLLNDPMMVELHGRFGDELATIAARDGIDAAIVAAFRRACTRRPDREEVATLRAFFARQRARGDERTAWSATARALLCLDEAVRRN